MTWRLQRLAWRCRKGAALNNRGDGALIRQRQDSFAEERRLCVGDRVSAERTSVMAALADGFEFARRVDDVEMLEGPLEAFVDFEGRPSLK